MADPHHIMPPNLTREYRSRHERALSASRSPEVRTTWDRYEITLEDAVRALGIGALPADSIEWTVRDDGKLEIIVRREEGP